MARLYDRKFSIVVANEAGKGIELAALRCRFAIRQWDRQTPNNMDLEITNLSRATGARMMKEFTRVQVSAGYEGQYGIIFDGTIIQARQGRSSPTDTYCHIVATDGDQAHNRAVLNTTLAAGSTPADVHQVVLKAMAPYGVAKGHTDPALTGPALPRGKVLFGMARDTMRDLSRSTGTSWSITNGRMDVVSPTGYLATEAVVITAETGMVGMPVITPEGIMLRCLLNPLLKPFQRIKLKNASIQQARLAPTFAGAQEPSFQLLPHTEDDGIYKILAVDHRGDTRGNDWYSEIACIAASQGATAASGARGRSAPTDIKPLQPGQARTGAAALPAVATDIRPLSVTSGAGI